MPESAAIRIALLAAILLAERIALLVATRGKAPGRAEGGEGTAAAWFLAYAGTLAGAVVAIVAGAPTGRFALGLLIVLAGAGLRAVSLRALGRFFSHLVVIREGHALVTTGPYRFLRHPLHVGLVAMIAGMAVVSGTAWAGALVALAVATAWVRERKEEAVLARVFGETWERHRSRTLGLTDLAPRPRLTGETPGRRMARAMPDRAPDDLVLLPAPRRVRRLGGIFEGPAGVEPTLEVRIDPSAVPDAEGYLLRVEPRRVLAVVREDAGAFYARQTLRQLARQGARPGTIPCVEIEDAPDLPNRGVMLDISRDKVPTMETLRALVELLSEWKLNRLQLYVEHTFAYEGHREVWEGASPMTGEEFETLDGWCREHRIELIPNQNSFGHMERWLVHPRYAPLAEIPFPVERLRAGERPGFMSLCPVDPRSIDLVSGLLAQLLPHFTSRLVNVGCDETAELGRGRSREEVERRGVGPVYLDFLLKIRDAVSRRGFRMQFWGDIVLEHPELIPELPKDLLALDWGYEADHPFDDECRRFAAAGLEFWVAPGTSSWLSIAGRTENMLGNVLAAAEAARAHGATGILTTDWGDHGHWQPLPVSYAGLSRGAALSWGLDANRDFPLARALDLHAYRDPAGKAGQASLDLGNVYREVGVLPKNASALALLLLFPERPLDAKSLAGLTREGLEGARASIARAARGLPGDEWRLAASMLDHACRLGIARLEAAGAFPEALPAATRSALAAELEAIVGTYRRVWLTRNREGGLEDSAGRLEALLRRYRAG